MPEGTSGSTPSYKDSTWESVLRDVLGLEMTADAAKIASLQWLLYHPSDPSGQFLIVSSDAARLKEYVGKDPKGNLTGVNDNGNDKRTSQDVYVNVKAIDPLLSEWLFKPGDWIGRAKANPRELNDFFRPHTSTLVALSFDRAGKEFGEMHTFLNGVGNKLTEVAGGESIKSITDLLGDLDKHIGHMVEEITSTTTGPGSVMRQVAEAGQAFLTDMHAAFVTWTSIPTAMPGGAIVRALQDLDLSSGARKLSFGGQWYDYKELNGNYDSLWKAVETYAKTLWVETVNTGHPSSTGTPAPSTAKGLHGLVSDALLTYIGKLTALEIKLKPLMTTFARTPPPVPGPPAPPGPNDVKTPPPPPKVGGDGTGGGGDGGGDGPPKPESGPPPPPLSINPNVPNPNLNNPNSNNPNSNNPNLNLNNPNLPRPNFGIVPPLTFNPNGPPLSLGQIRPSIGAPGSGLREEDTRGALGLRLPESDRFPMLGDGTDGLVNPWEALNPGMSRQEMVELLTQERPDPQVQGGNPGSGTPGMGSGGVPFFPPMAGGMGGMGGGQGQNDRERERTTWLAEDERVWGVDTSLRGATAIGRPDPDTEDEFEEYRNPRPARPGQTPNQTRGQR